MNHSKTKVLLVDDHTLVRRGVAMLLQDVPTIKVVGEAASGAEALRLVAERAPDVVLMDLGLPDMDGARVTQQIMASPARPRVLALSAFTDRRHIFDVMRAGATGYVVKDSAVDELVQAIETVASGERYLSPAIASMLLNSLADTEPQSSSGRLTVREREVLQLLAEGKAMKQAAVQLQISTKTVETHRRAIMEKLQLFSVAELTKHAIREGLTTLD